MLNFYDSNVNIKSLTGFYFSGIPVFIKTRDNKQLTFTVKTTETVQDLKVKIIRKEGHKVTRQSLFFNGVKMEDSKTLAHYNIKSNSSLELGEL